MGMLTSFDQSTSRTSIDRDNHALNPGSMQQGSSHNMSTAVAFMQYIYIQSSEKFIQVHFCQLASYAFPP